MAEEPGIPPNPVEVLLARMMAAAEMLEPQMVSVSKKMDEYRRAYESQQRMTAEAQHASEVHRKARETAEARSLNADELSLLEDLVEDAMQDDGWGKKRRNQFLGDLLGKLRTVRTNG